MYEQAIYADLRKNSPRCFEIAERMYHLVLESGRLVVRGLVVHMLGNPLIEVAQIEVVGVNRPLLSDSPNTLFRLSFRAELNARANEIGVSETSLQVNGPAWEGRLLRGDDLKSQLATFVCEWSENKALIRDRGKIDQNPWVDWKADPFVGCLVLPKGVQTDVQSHHPLILPFISMCFGSFHDSFEEKLEMVRRTGGGNANAREESLRLFLRRFDSFVAQTQRENVRNCLGSLFAS